MTETILVTLWSIGCVIIGGYEAHKDRFLTPGQIIKRGIKGLPFIAHGGMWGDIFILSPLLGIISGKYVSIWSAKKFFIALLLGILGSSIMHLFYIGSNILEAHTQYGRLTRSGKIHFFYMALVLQMLILFYCFTPNPNPKLLWWTTILLSVHMVFGTHVVLGLIAPTWYPDKPLRNPTTWITIFSCSAVLLWRTIYILR